MALDSNKIADNFIDQIKQGSSPTPKIDNTVVVTDDTDPSAIGGLAALGATIVGAGVLAKRIPGARALLQNLKKDITPNKTFTPNKPVEEIADIPTATGQSSELITTPSKELVIGRSRIGEVQNIPFTQGKGYTEANPLVGSATFDRIMEAPFEKGTAQQWSDWLIKANRADLKIATGPLAGVSRRVSPDELDELNIIKFDKQGKGESGFLKVMDDQNMEVDRETLLELVKNSPVNKLKTIRLGVRGDPEGDFISIQSSFRDAVNKSGVDTSSGNAEISEFVDRINSNLRKVINGSYTQKEAIPSGIYTEIQDDLVKIGRLVDNPQDFSKILVNFNRDLGKYNSYSKKLDKPEFLRFRRDKSDNPNFYPTYKTGMGYTYKMDAGENFVEDVIFYPGRVPNTVTGKFSPIDEVHYIDNEIGFIRYDDLANPKLNERFGLKPNARHLRISEIQTDIHSPQFGDNKASYFKRKINPFNRDAELEILKKQRAELLSKKEPFEELGRGISGLTKKQRQELVRINYEIGQLEKSSLSKLINNQPIEYTTAAPLARSWPDYAAKSILRTMAERGINAVSVVPSPMNKAIKMPSFSTLGDEINYGLMDGKALIKTADGSIKKTNQLAVNVAPFAKLAKQYGAKFELFPMPKSNPDKPFKVIAEYTTRGGRDGKNVQAGRIHYNKKIGDQYVYEDHVGAANSYDEALEIMKNREGVIGDRGKLIIKEIGKDNPDLYEKVPTLIASDDVLRKFLLPMKAYMKVGGFVDKTNIFKGLL